MAPAEKRGIVDYFVDMICWPLTCVISSLLH